MPQSFAYSQERIPTVGLGETVAISFDGAGGASVLPLLDSAHYNAAFDDGTFQFGGTFGVINRDISDDGALVLWQIEINGFIAAAFTLPGCAGCPDVSTDPTGLGIEIRFPFSNTPSGTTPAWSIRVLLTNLTAVHGVGGLDFNSCSIGIGASSISHGTTPIVPVFPPSTTITTVAARSGMTLHDTTTISGNIETVLGDLGHVIFKLYDPTNTIIFTDSQVFTNTGIYTSASYTVPAPGLYKWTAEYDGGDFNAPGITSLSDPLEQLTVTSGGLMPYVCLVGAT